MNRNFLTEIQEPAWSVVVDLGSAVQVARAGVGESPLDKLTAIAGREPAPVFDPPRRDPSVASATVATARGLAAPPGFDTGRFVEFPVDGQRAATDLAAEIRKGQIDQVTEVLPVPAAVPALGPASMEPASNASAFNPPNFFDRQSYVAPGPAGFGFLQAWSLPGGDASGVTIIDVEGGWRTSHDELQAARFSLWSGNNTDADSWQDHGCAVVSLLSASHNGMGTASICPGARVGMVSVFEGKPPGRQRIANQIFNAGMMLNAGDVLLLELQRPGPRTQYAADADQKGYVPLVFWPDVRAVVRDLVARGVTVVSVAGNGGENLDDEIYGDRFDPSKSDSGCIMVGAGAPPFGDFGPARSRLAFSNYGAAIDVQAWGQMVTTAGYGDLWGGQDTPDRRYTARFMGTSSAGPLIAGLVACVQGRHKAVFGVPLNPLYLRQMLRTVGWRAEDDEAAEQGRPSFALQPDLAELFARLDLA